MHFAILDIEEKSDENGKYVTYGITINGGKHSSLRYRQLREFHEQLKKEFGLDRIHVPFPPKKLLSLNQTQIEERRELLEKYLQAVSQDSEIIRSRTFVKFLLKAQKDHHKVEDEDVKLDLYLMNGKKFQVDIRNTGSTDYVMQEAMSQIKLPSELVKYFALFLVGKEEDGEISVVRKLQGFESPFLVLLPYKDTHRLVVRKDLWNSKIEDELYKDSIALNLLYVQAVSDVERNWVLTTPEVLKELNSLKAQNARKKYLKLARSQKFYNYLQFHPCTMDFPEKESQVLINLGGYELIFRLLVKQQKQGGKEGSFKVTRIKCWRVISSKDDKTGEIVTKIAFQYLFTKEKLEWITICSQQAMLMSLCLQSMVDEIVRDRSKQNTAKGTKQETPKPKPKEPKEQPAKSPQASTDKQDVKPVKPERRDSGSSTGSNEGSREKNGDTSSSEKQTAKKGKKNKKIASVKNEIFAEDIGDEDL